MESVNAYCMGCLGKLDYTDCKRFTLENEVLKLPFQSHAVILCYICCGVAKKVEKFIKNVHRNEHLLQKYNNILDASSKNELIPTPLLSLISLETIKLPGNAGPDYDKLFAVTVSTNLRAHKICNVKDESIEYETNISSGEGDYIEYSEDPHVEEVIVENSKQNSIKKHFMNGKKPKKHPVHTKQLSQEVLTVKFEALPGNEEVGETQPSIDLQNCKDIKVKQEIAEVDIGETYNLEDLNELDEDDYPIQLLLKKADNESDNFSKHVKSSRHFKKKAKRKVIKEEQEDTEKITWEVIHLTREDIEEERMQRAKESKYTHAQYKCTDCFVGFTFEMSFQKHMEKHCKSSGDYVCDVCKIRTTSKYKLYVHRKKHEIRYKCSKCGVKKNDRPSIKDHYVIAHGECNRHVCPHCSNTYKMNTTLRKHIFNIHRAKNPAVCMYCSKVFRNRDILKSHMLTVHEKEVYKKEVERKHICLDCGKAFKTPSQLKYHSTKHSRSRDYYCVECDNLSCCHCDKRFAIKRDLDRHMNRVHLNIRPYQCDQCPKSYINNWSLKAHKKLSHEGYKKPLIYQCEFCDKAFARSQILKHHIRTHTGERPYECEKCAARFTQANVLNTHVRLVHLKLTRDGRPKNGVK